MGAVNGADLGRHVCPNGLPVVKWACKRETHLCFGRLGALSFVMGHYTGRVARPVLL